MNILNTQYSILYHYTQYSSIPNTQYFIIIFIKRKFLSDPFEMVTNSDAWKEMSKKTKQTIIFEDARYCLIIIIIINYRVSLIV